MKTIKTYEKYDNSETSELDSNGSDMNCICNDESSDDSEPTRQAKKNKSMSEIKILKEVLGKLDYRKSIDLDKFDEKRGA